MRARRIQMWVGASFGLAYVVANAGRLPAPAPEALRVLAVAAVVGLAVAMRRVGLAVAAAGGSAAAIAWIAGIAPGALLLASAFAPLVRRGAEPARP